jgi:hypothetical protein
VNPKVKENLERFADRILGRARYFGLYRYRARFLGDPALPDLVPLNQDPLLGLPTLRATKLAFGTPGMTARVKTTSIVVIAFEGGDPNAPFVHSFVEGTAKDIAVVVEDELTVKGPLSATTSPVLLADPVLTWLQGPFSAYVASVQTLLAAVVLLLEPTPGPLDAKLVETTSAALAMTNGIATLAEEYPAGAKAGKVRAA